MKFKVEYFPGYKVWTSGIYMIRRGAVRRKGGPYSAYARSRSGRWLDIIRPGPGDHFRNSIKSAKEACAIHQEIRRGMRGPDRGIKFEEGIYDAEAA